MWWLGVKDLDISRNLSSYVVPQHLGTENKTPKPSINTIKTKSFEDYLHWPLNFAILPQDKRKSDRTRFFEEWLGTLQLQHIGTALMITVICKICRKNDVAVVCVAKTGASWFPNDVLCRHSGLDKCVVRLGEHLTEEVNTKCCVYLLSVAVLRAFC